MPLFSIITPALNAESTLREALESARVADPGGRLSEHLLIDGLSTDRTTAVAGEFPGVSVFSQKDRGLYDAMNIGAQKACGDFLVFLQADDWLLPGSLQAAAAAITAGPETCLISCGAEAVKQKPDGTWETVWRRDQEGDHSLDFARIALGEPMINARIFSRNLFLERGGFDITFGLAADRKFLLQLAQENPKARSLDLMLYRYRWHEGSRTMTESNKLSAQLTLENLRIAEAFLSGSLSSIEREAVRAWHRKQSVQLAMMELECAGPAGFLRAAVRGTSVSARWPSAFAAEFLRCLPGFLARGCRTRSQVAAGKIKDS